MQEDFVAACYFLNVGQGTSQVIHLGKKRAIVIDTGPQWCPACSPLLSLLKNRDIQKIEALILSHNDQDHIGEAAAVLDNYKKRIDRVCFLEDRSRDKNKQLYNILKSCYRKKYIKQVIRLENDDKPKTLFAEGDISIDLLFPGFSQNIFAAQPNNTSAIIALSIGTQTVIFSGDAPIEAWKDIVEKNGRIESQMITIPHHGGGFIYSKSEKQFVNDLNWFHDKAMQTKFAIVSAGTNNTYKHPSPQIIRSFAKRNIEVLCTQATSQCTGNAETCEVICCGTIVANIGLNMTQIKNLDGFRAGKEKMPNRLCVS